MRQVLGAGALGRPRGTGWRGRREGGSGWGTQVNPWLIHVNVWEGRFYPQAGESPRRGPGNPTSVFLPGESQGQRSLGGSRPRGHKESDVTEETLNPCTLEWSTCHIFDPVLIHYH